MALSNIRNEPRREITESLLGIIAFGIFLFGDYKASDWLISVLPQLKPLPILMIFLPIVSGATVFLVFLGIVGLLETTHSLGESICGWLARRNLDPRPKNRYPV